MFDSLYDCRMKRLLILLVPMLSCVGVDVLDIELFEERIQISTFPLQLQVGDSFQMEAVFFDSIGQPSSSGLVWSSSAPEVALISSAGELTGLAEGTTEVSVMNPKYTDVSASMVIEVTQGETLVSSSIRTGSLQGVGGYAISGEFLMYEDSTSGDLMLDIIDAQIDNTAPGPFFYLSNLPNAVNGGISFGEAFNGNYQFILPDTLTVQSYDVLVVWCEPFGVTLGYGNFDE